MKRTILLSIAVIASLIFNSCKDPVGVTDNFKMKQEISFEDVYKGSYAFSTSKPINAVVRSKTEEEAMLKLLESNIFQINGSPMTLDLGDINYDEEMLICMALGSNYSSSIVFSITEVFQDNNKIKVESSMFVPEIVTYDIVCPVHIVKVKKSDLPVEFAQTKVIKLNKNRMNLNFVTISQNSRFVTTQNKIYQVIRDKAEESEFLSKLESSIYDSAGNKIIFDMGNIDYDNEMVIAVHYGPSPSGSNFIEIPSIVLENDTITVYSKYYIPEIGTDDIGYPYHIVKLAKRSEPVIFAETETIHLKSENINYLKSTSWNWVAYQNSDGSYITPIIDDPSWVFDINFDETSGWGNSGCNNYGFDYSENESYLNIEMKFMTKVNCKLTGEYMQALNSAVSFKMSDDLLYIQTNDNKYVTLIFKKK